MHEPLGLILNVFIWTFPHGCEPEQEKVEQLSGVVVLMCVAQTLRHQTAAPTPKKQPPHDVTHWRRGCVRLWPEWLIKILCLSLPISLSLIFISISSPPSPVYLLSLTTYSLSIFMFQSISIFIPHLFIPLIIHLFICFSICQSSIYLSIAGVSNLFFAAGHIVVVVSFGELL